MRMGQSTWRLLLAFGVLLGALLVGGVLDLVISGPGGRPAQDGFGLVFVVAAGAAFLLALVVGGLGINETAADAGTLPVSVPGMPVVILSPEDSQVADRHRRSVAGRRGTAMVLGIIGFAFLGFALLVALALWVAAAAIAATLVLVALVLGSSRGT